MTLLLTCLTPRYVVQVSDRRLTNVATSKPVDDDACKAILVAGRAIVGYTGLANLKRPPAGQTDLWLVDQIASDPELDDLGLLRDAATVAFRDLRGVPQTGKRHSFAIAGWDGEGSTAVPYWATVSNAENTDGTWRNAADETFSVQRQFLRRTRVEVRASGQPLHRETRRVLTRALEQCEDRQEPAECLVARLIEAMRHVASSNSFVGSGALATVLPREAIDTEGIRMPGGLAFGAEGTPLAMAFYFPSDQSAGTLYTPHYVSKGMQMSDVQIHDRVMGPEEIKARYEAGLKRRQ